MFKHILVATDCTALGDRAITMALRLAADARVTALHVARDYGMADFAAASFQAGRDLHDLRERLSQAAQQRIQQVIERFGESARRIDARVAIGDRPYEEIIATADRLACDLIVMATHGRGAVESALLGSQTLKVLSLVRQPVLVVR